MINETAKREKTLTEEEVREIGEKVSEAFKEHGDFLNWWRNKSYEEISRNPHVYF